MKRKPDPSPAPASRYVARWVGTLVRRRRAFTITEVVILISAVLVATAAACIAIPRAMTRHYKQNRDVLAAPF